jgi:hypothetical protein
MLAGVQMGEFEAIGDAVTGGLLGRALEQNAGEVGPDGRTHETHCLNCGTELIGEFCHACGQHAHVRRTLTSLVHDFLHGLLNFEGKIWRTLPLLAWKPGALTRRYIDGQRSTFVSPIALFLFSIFLMFAAVEATDAGFGSAPASVKKDLSAQIKVEEQKLAKLEADRALALKNGHSTKAIDKRVSDLKAELTAIKAIKDKKIPVAQFQLDDDDNAPRWLRDSVETAAKNPELTLYKLQNNASKFSWLIIPLSVPFVWLLFPFSRRFRPYDHAVFVTYSLCFMSLLVVAGVLLQSAGLTAIAGLLWLIPPFHIYRQLKGAYELTRWGALWRTALLTLFALLVISLFAALVVGVGLFD